jgi:flagellar biosynthesis/type III secretory pathway chaperone
MAVATSQMTVCRVNYTDDWIEVTSPTGKKVRICPLGQEEVWDFFTQEEKDMFNRVTKNHSGCQVSISYDDMRLFIRAWEKLEKAKQECKDTQLEVLEVEPAEEPVVKGPSMPQEPRKSLTPEEKAREATLASLASLAHNRFVSFSYDIPQPLNRLNPSGRMWRYGFRLTLSQWVMPIGQLHRIKDITDEFDANGVEWFTLEFAESERQKLQDRSVKEISKELAAIHTSLIETIGSADEQLRTTLEATEVVLTDRERQKKISYRDSRIRAALKNSGERLNNVIQTAILFDEQERTEDLFSALREVIATRNATFNLEVESRYKK